MDPRWVITSCRPRHAPSGLDPEHCRAAPLRVLDGGPRHQSACRQGTCVPRRGPLRVPRPPSRRWREMRGRGHLERGPSRASTRLCGKVRKPGVSHPRGQAGGPRQGIPGEDSDEGKGAEASRREDPAQRRVRTSGLPGPHDGQGRVRTAQGELERPAVVLGESASRTTASKKMRGHRLFREDLFPASAGPRRGASREQVRNPGTREPNALPRLDRRTPMDCSETERPGKGS